MAISPRPSARSFKTHFFAKQARKAKISDGELCRIVSEFATGKATDLGGGVFKQRLHHNEYRSILIAKGRDYWVLEFLFAKKDAENITRAALDGFRTLADRYAALNPRQLELLIEAGDLEEICHATDA